MKVSFIGIGNMGTPMAAHLIARGFDVTVFDVRQEAAREFVTAHGGKMGTSLAEAGRDAQAAITMLPDHSDVRKVLLGADGLVSVLTSGAIAIDMSTSDPNATRSIGHELAERGDLVVSRCPRDGGCGLREGRNTGHSGWRRR